MKRLTEFRMFKASLASHITPIDLQIAEDIIPFKLSVPKFVLIGLGPYAKHHFFNLFKKHNIYPDLVVDLDCMESKINEFLSTTNVSIPRYLIPNDQRDFEKLPISIQKDLLQLIKKHGITHAIMCTEPKAHLAYLDFLIENDIHILAAKPLTAPQNSSISYDAASKIQSDYDYLVNKLKSKKDLKIELQCQRRYNPIYQFVMREIETFVAEFDIPMTYCEIYHSEGMWNMPDEFLSRENHPYKYGYGKLLHGGYHFIDLLAWLINTCYRVSSKIPDRGEIYAVPFSPSDFMTVFNNEDYKRFFQKDKYSDLFSNDKKAEFEQMGELDFFGILQLFKDDKRLTTCSLNLLHTGFSRRSWDTLPEDTYKGNGRIRHERINIQFGHLLNIQVHSYISKREHEKSSQYAPGSARHFDIYIFRNSKLIGGEPFKHYRADHFLKDPTQSFNEMSRDKCFFNFFRGEKSLSQLTDHTLGVKLLSNSLKALTKKNENEASTVKFPINLADFYRQ